MNIAERFAWVRAVIAAEPRPTLAEVSVAVTLAEHYNAERGEAWPAQQRIAHLTRMHRRSIRKALDELEQRGFIACVKGGGPRSSARFTLVVPTCADCADFAPRRDGALQRHQMAPHSALRGRSATPAEGALQRPEQVGFRSDSGGKPYCPAASARSANATRARGGQKAAPSNQRRTGQPVTPTKL
jgi:DNA-binding transcriptional MocR family regulator